MANMRILLFVGIALTHFTYELLAQEDSNRSYGIVRSLGIQLAYSDTYSDERIGVHPAFAGFLELLLLEEVGLRIELEYFEANKSLSGTTFQYKGMTYVSIRPQVWQNLSLNAAFYRWISSRSCIGVGLGADFISVRRITYKEPVFWVDFFTDTPHIVPSSIVDETAKLLKPSISIFTNTEWECGDHVSLFVGLHYQIIFVGEEYGHTAINSQNTYGVCAGFKYMIQ